MKKSLLFLSFFLLFWRPVFSQPYSNLRTQQLVIRADTTRLDSVSLVPGSVMIFHKNHFITDSFYQINYIKSLLIAHDSIQYIPLKISYRVFPYDFSKTYVRKMPSQILPDEINYAEQRQRYTIDNTQDDFFNDATLDKNGSISRGISFGNNQDVIVNSNLNLQLNGKISKDMSIRAAISDENIPVQAEGTSQQLREFDKVFMQIYNEKMQLTVGDFELHGPEKGFLCFNKKLQGANFSVNYQVGKNKVHSQISGAVAKGKYTRNNFNGIEGNQGPYQLKGAENEKYVVVLAGTERVYINGKLLTRGEENDYVINYNTAEITFTPGQPITKDSRIVVEFEYSEKNYTRFLFYTSHEIKTQKSRFWLNLYNEQDSKNQPLQQELSVERKSVLEQIGDSLNQALVSNIEKITQDSIGLIENAVLYRMTDSLVNGIRHDSIFVFAPNADSALYRLGFTEVGENQGHYIRSNTGANGRIFQWVAPENTIPQGNYQPVILLVTPKKKQLLSIGSENQLSENLQSFIEFSTSLHDLNTFSPMHSKDDRGYALKTGLKKKILAGDTSKNSTLARIDYQLISANFIPIERFRATEFERDWNLESYLPESYEHFLHAMFSFQRKKDGGIFFDSELLNRNENYQGWKNTFTSNWKIKNFSFQFNGSLLNTRSDLHQTQFLRYRSSATQHLKIFNAGIAVEEENNHWENLENKQLNKNSFHYRQFEVFIENPDSANNSFSAGYTFRKDKLPVENILKHSSTGEDFHFNYELLQSKQHNFSTNVNYRRLSVADTALSPETAENTLTGRIRYGYKSGKGVFNSTSFYETGTGLERKKEYTYLEVAQGQGAYQWKDYNENGIRELNEFEIANFKDEANFVRLLSPTDDYVKVYANKINQVISLFPVRIWRKEKGIKKFISYFSEQLAIQAGQKTTRKAWLPKAVFENNDADSTLTGLTANVRNTFSFNKGSNKFGMDYIFQDTQNRNLMSTGIETRGNQQHNFQLRWNIFHSFFLNSKLISGTRKNRSQFFENKNYTILFLEQENKINYQFENFISSLGYNYIEKQNKNGNEAILSHQLNTEISLNQPGKGNLSFNFNYINIRFQGEENNPVAYQMLEGFKPGNNFTWMLNIVRNLSGNLQMNLNYTGRKSEQNKMIHTGGMQLRMLF